MKPHKGQLYSWQRVHFDPTKYDFKEGETLGYIIVGFLDPTLRLGTVRQTSAVVSHVGNEIETLNSRYTLVDRRGG